ncbi:MAG TPA: PQQ-dependent sugar dehydrogenase [Burkholderiaceae bacterium]|nr:PQQ-dependent sugar dehydrogenase [Burkholderiaceae bacterium]
MRARQIGLQILTVLSATVLLASCGGGDSASPAPAPASGPSPPGSTSPAPAPGVDTQAPTVTLTGPAAFATDLLATLNVSATATDDVGVTGVEFQIDGVQIGGTLTSPPFAASVDTTAYASGQHVLRVRASDAAGNVSAWASATVQFGGSRTQPAGFSRTTWVTGFGAPTAIAQAPDGRIFLAEQGGALRVVDTAGTLLSTAAIQLTVDSTSERGLIGVAVDPDFTNNGYIYLHYTTPVGGSHGRVSRFTLVPPASNTVSVGSEVILAELPTLSGPGNHNGGAIHFGADGKLYVAVGDDATGANSQSTTTRLGKMLRINADGTIPTDNPFYATLSGDNRSIWATGLRNPFTFAVQPVTGKIYINDVGQGAWEEIDLGAAGANYGWPSTEGPTNAAGVTAPLFAYGHSAASPAGSGPGGFFTGQAIIGGAFYPDSGPFPAIYRGSYFFADLGTGFVARYDSANNAAYTFGDVGDAPVGMLVGTDGALYVLTLNSIVRFSAP